ncbi:MAG: penicillin-binding protein activator [Gammaproteobacteria bacterium]|nr:penicillin-binding protein activator [Gammaproteobacteria bacterium]
MPAKLPKFLVSLLILLLLGCTPSDNRASGGNPNLISPSEVVNEADRNRLKVEAGRLAAQAANSPAPQRELLYMKAAEAYLRAEDINSAAATADKVNSGLLPPANQFDWNMLSAEINMKRGSAGTALRSLQDTPAGKLNREQQRRLYLNQAEANRLSGNLLESARARTELDALLDDPQQKMDNQMRIIKTLPPLSDTALELLQPSPPGLLGGWMELARIFKQHGENLEQAKPAYERWRARFPEHPAAADIYASHYGKVQTQYNRLEQVAVLLPQSGPLKDSAAAIRSGIMAAYYAEPNERRPSLKFYDSSKPGSLAGIYDQAVKEGAVAVIGPLDKRAVAEIAALGDLSLPTLALNRISSTSGRPPGNLYQFALAPEDEAEQAAERAWHDGHRAALVMAPDSAWGKRVFDAFRSRWVALGGNLLDQVFYKEKQHDFSKEIRTLLKIDTSVARHKQMQRELGRKLESEPKPRSDADFIFLAASPEKGREIRPQLQFNFAGAMPLYATSRVYSGVTNLRLDRDLNGIRFPDHPWLLVEEDGPTSRQAVAKLFPSSRNKFPRLHSMGIDSYVLLSRLAELANNPQAAHDGKTGILRLDANRQIQQQMLWAEMKDGKPVVLGYVPRADLQNPASPSPAPLNQPSP